jgi:hypothetical protein
MLLSFILALGIVWMGARTIVIPFVVEVDIPIASESSNSIKRLCGAVRLNYSRSCSSYRWQQKACRSLGSLIEMVSFTLAPQSRVSYLFIENSHRHSDWR